MKVAIDTNVLVYAEEVNGTPRQVEALALIRRLPHGSTFVPVQVFGELFNVLVRKGRMSPLGARSLVRSWQIAFASIDTSPDILSAAMDLSAAHGLSIWDAVILAASAAGGCEMLLSEDMHDGFTWNGVTVVNPFASERHPLLASLLDEP